MTFAELMQNYVNTPYDELVSFARQEANKIIPVLKSCYNGDDAKVFQFFCLAVGATIAVDGKLSALEGQFARDVLGDGFTDDILVKLGNTYGGYAQALDEIIDSFENSVKYNLCNFCCCFLAVDHTITREESAFAAKLIG